MKLAQAVAPAPTAAAINAHPHTAGAYALSRACIALWAATVSLMTAFMHTSAPAHRYLLARRIAANFATLRLQECFAPECRETFARLSDHWKTKADQMAPHNGRPRGGIGLLCHSLLKPR